MGILIPSIDLKDMSGLRVIAHLEANGQSAMAARIAENLKSEKARRVAKILMKGGPSHDKAAKRLASILVQENKPKYSVKPGGRIYSRSARQRRSTTRTQSSTLT